MGGKGKELRTLPKGNNRKMKVIAPLELELVYLDVTIQHISHYDIGNPFSQEESKLVMKILFFKFTKVIQEFINILVGWFVFLFNGISTFVCYLMPKPFS